MGPISTADSYRGLSGQARPRDLSDCLDLHISGFDRIADVPNEGELVARTFQEPFSCDISYGSRQGK